MPSLNETDRWRAVGMIEAGVRHTDVARPFGVHRNTVDALWRRYQQFGTTRDRCRSGHPRVMSNRQDTYIRVVHPCDRLRTATLKLDVFLVLGGLVPERYVIDCVDEAYGHDVQPDVLLSSNVIV